MSIPFQPAHKVTNKTHAPGQIRPAEQEIRTLADMIQATKAIEEKFLGKQEASSIKESLQVQKDIKLGFPPDTASKKEAAHIKLCASVKMICNVLERDAADGKPVRGEMAELLKKDFENFLKEYGH